MRKNKIHNSRKRSIKKSRSISNIKRTASKSNIKRSTSKSNTIKLSKTRKCRNKRIFRKKRDIPCECRRCSRKKDDKIGRRFYSGIMAGVLAMAIFV